MKRGFLTIFFISVILLFTRLGSTSVFQVAEARNAQCAYEMMTGSDLITPTFNRQLRVDKPAMEYYAIIISYKLFGVNEGSARFFSAVCGLIFITATYFFVKKHVDAESAWWSSFVLISSMHIIMQFRLATPDPYLIVCHVLSLYCFYEGFKSGIFKWYVFMYILWGLAFFAKGPVGLLIPAFTIVLFLLFAGQLTLKRMAQLRPWLGVLLVIIISAPWYYLVYKHTNGAWTKGFFLDHNIGRFNEPVDDHGGIFIITFLFVLLGMFPFSFYFIRTLKNVWKNKLNNDFLVFCSIAFFTVIVFYFFSKTRLINYTVPAYSFLAIIIGCWLSKIFQEKKYSLVKPELIVICFISLLLPAGIYLWATNTEPVNKISWITWPLWLLPAGAIVALVIRKTNTVKAFTVIGYTYMAATFIIVAWLLPAIDSQTAMVKHKQFISNANNVVAYDKFNDAFLFYLKKPVRVFNNIDSLTRFVNANNQVTVLYNGVDAGQLDSLSSIRLYSKDRDLFSSKYSFIYIKNK